MPDTISAPAGISRLEELDVLRGLVILLMAFDHLCDFFGVRSYNATDLSVATAAQFISRWITHLCAPCFVFLAGTGAFLLAGKGDSLDRPGQFLAARGLMLVLIEQTLLRCFGWYFNCDYHYMNGNVLFGAGLAMVLLAPCLRLPGRAVFLAGAGIIILHGFTAFFTIPDNAWWRWIMIVLFRSGDISFGGGYHFYVSYPVVPWFGIMALGYGAGRFMVNKGTLRRRPILFAGLVMLALFVALRLPNLYGDPQPWAAQRDALFTVLSFINCEKYPPSLLFTLITLGIGALLLSWAGKWPSFIRKGLVTFGRVPLFFYLLHIPFIHAAAVLYSLVRFGGAAWLHRGPGIFWYDPLPGHPADYGLSLGWAIAAWAAVMAMLYVPCRWYGEYKFRRRSRWMKYL